MVPGAHMKKPDCVSVVPGAHEKKPDFVLAFICNPSTPVAGWETDRRTTQKLLWQLAWSLHTVSETARETLSQNRVGGRSWVPKVVL